MTRFPVRIATLLLAGVSLCRADCYPFEEAPQHVGEMVCIRGRVLKVAASSGGTHYLNFCENYLVCPFTVVVFPGHLEDIGDVRSLENQYIEIDGLVKLYQGRPEIVLTESAQLHGDAVSKIPPLPKNYDVVNHGKFSAGRAFPKKPKRSKTKRSRSDNIDPFSEGSQPD